MGHRETSKWQRMVGVILVWGLALVALLALLGGIYVVGAGQAESEESPTQDADIMDSKVGGPPDETKSVPFTALPNPARADGFSTVTVTARVRDSAGDVVPNTFVGFTTTGGVLPYAFVEAESGDVTKYPFAAWTTNPNANASGGAYIECNAQINPSAYVLWHFQGQAVSVILATFSDGGRARVLVYDSNGVVLEDLYIDTYSAGEAWKVEQIILKNAPPPPAWNRLEVYPMVWAGRKRVRLDALRSGAVSGGDGNAVAILTAPSVSQTITTCGTFVRDNGTSFRKCATVACLTSIPTTVTVTANPATLQVGGQTAALEVLARDQFGLPVLDGTRIDLVTSDHHKAYLKDRYVETDLADVVKTGQFLTPHAYAQASGGDIRWSLMSGDYVRWTFTGTAIALIHNKQFNAYDAKVTIDGGAPQMINMYDAGQLWQVETIVSEVLPHGRHTITVEVPATNPPGSPYVLADAFRNIVKSSGGQVYGTLASGTVTGQVLVTATCGSATGVTTVTITAGSPQTITISPDPVTAPCHIQVPVTAQVTDRYSNPVTDGTPVTFTSSLSGIWITNPALTSGGLATSHLESSEAGTGVITAKAGSIEKTAILQAVSGPPVVITCTASPTQIIASGIHTATITVQARDACNNQMSNGTVVTISTDIGTVGSSTVNKTFSGGVAKATLTSQVGVGTAHITATIGALSDTTTVNFIAGPIHHINVTFGAGTAACGGDLTVYARPKDQWNNDLPDGLSITFSDNLGGSFSPKTAPTVGGRATTHYTGHTAGTGTITATCGSVVGSRTVNAVAGPPSTASMTANPTQIIASGSATSTITLTAHDACNNLVNNGTWVTFTTDLGSICPIYEYTPAELHATDPDLSLSGPGWTTDPASPACDPGRIYSKTLNDQAIYQFTGSAVKIYYEAKNDRGKAEIRIDGLLVMTLDTYVNDTTPQCQAVMVTDSLPCGLHTLTVTVLNQKSAASSDTWVSLLAFESGAATKNGQAKATLTSGTTLGTAHITGIIGAVNAATTVQFIPGPPHLVTILNTEPINTTCQGTVAINVRVRDQWNHNVANGTQVSFASNLGGSFSPNPALTSAGDATSIYTGYISGTGTITATAGPKMDTAVLKTGPSAPASLSVSTSTSYIGVGGTSLITATVKDACNNWVANGTPVTFTTDLGTIGSSQVVKSTTNGQAVATLTAGGMPGLATITVTAQSNLRQVVQVRIVGDPATMLVYADPTVVNVNGGTSTITADVRDNEGWPVADGTMVTFGATLGTLAPNPAPTVNGLATTIFTAGPITGTANINATAGAANGATTLRVNGYPVAGVALPTGSYCRPVQVTQVFTTTYSDPDGWTDIGDAYFLLNVSSITQTHCVYLRYDRTQNKMYLRNDANTSWLGGYKPGIAATISNSYATLDVSHCKRSGAGQNLTVSWAVIFANPFSGKIYNEYLRVVDLNNASSGWVQVGTWGVTRLPTPKAVVPKGGGSVAAGVPQTFITYYVDNDGATTIRNVYLLITTTCASGVKCFFARYDQAANKLYLRNDTDTAWLPGGGLTPGVPGTVSNSYAILDAGQCAVAIPQPNKLKVTWKVTFKPSFIGSWYRYSKAEDNVGAVVCKRKGAWIVY